MPGVRCGARPAANLRAALVTSSRQQLPNTCPSAKCAQVSASVVGSRALLQLSGLNLSFPYNLSMPGSTVQIPLQVVLHGTLALEAAVGCPAACGAHGRCWLGEGAGAANGTAAPAAPACECECGWAGEGQQQRSAA